MQSIAKTVQMIDEDLRASLEKKREAAIAYLGDKYLLHSKNSVKNTGHTAKKPILVK